MCRSEEQLTLVNDGGPISGFSNSHLPALLLNAEN